MFVATTDEAVPTSCSVSSPTLSSPHYVNPTYVVICVENQPVAFIVRTS